MNDLGDGYYRVNIKDLLSIYLNYCSRGYKAIAVMPGATALTQPAFAQGMAILPAIKAAYSSFTTYQVKPNENNPCTWYWTYDGEARAMEWSDFDISDVMFRFKYLEGAEMKNRRLPFGLGGIPMI